MLYWTRKKASEVQGNRGARDKPKDSYGGSDYSLFFGRSTSGKNVNERTAMQTTTVYSCVWILGEAVASLPIQIEYVIQEPKTGSGIRYVPISVTLNTYTHVIFDDAKEELHRVANY